VLKSILVGLDGSPYSEAAIELGICWAKRRDALLVGLGIIDEAGIYRPEPIPLGAAHFKRERDETLLADAHHKVDRFLERFTLRCSDAGVACKLLEDVGLPADQIVLEAQRYDLILLGRRTFFRFETGEGPDQTLHDVLKISPRPVVAVPNSALRQGRTVVVAYDGSLQAARALQAFQATNLHEAQTVHVVCVGSRHMEAAQQADRAADFLRLHEIESQVHPLVASVSPGQVLLEKVRELDATLVVMGAYGQPTWREFCFGSVTRTLLKLSPVPLFLYH
jgi:nucleotide-binding universal stress UspA family protein